MATDRDIMVARESYSTEYDGAAQFIRKGVTRARRGHPLVEQNPEYWEPIDVHYDVERATANPGEKRQRERAGTAS